MREVRVLDGTETDLLGQLLVAATVLDDVEGAFHGLGEQVVELDEVALAGGDRLALVAHEAERHMHELDGVAHLAGDVEPLLEVELLTGVGDVDDALGVVLLHAHFNAGEVARGVVIATVRLADDRDAELLLLEVDDKRAVGLDREAHLLQACDDARHRVVVVRLAAVGVELDAELVVHAVEFVDGDLDELLPKGQVLGVALLELHELGLAGLLPEPVLLLGLRRGEDVALLEVGNGEVVALLLREQLTVALDEDAELRAPVAQVVVGDDVVAKGAEDAVDRVADDGGTDVADVHLLRGVRRRVVDDDLLARTRLGDAQHRLAVQVGETPGQPGGGDGDVEEAGAGELDLLDEVRLRLHQLRVDGLRDLPRREVQHLRARKRIVALEVAKFRIRCGNRPDLGEVITGERSLKAALQPLFNRHLSLNNQPNNPTIKQLQISAVLLGELLKTLRHRELVDGAEMVHIEDTLQMIRLVKHGARKESLHGDDLRHAVDVGVLTGDLGGAHDRGAHVREAEAALLAILGPLGRHDDGIEHHERHLRSGIELADLVIVLAARRHVDHAHGLKTADLLGREPDAARLVHRLEHVLGDLQQGRGNRGNRARDLAQDLVPIFHDIKYHSTPVEPKPPEPRSVSSVS